MPGKPPQILGAVCDHFDAAMGLSVDVVEAKNRSNNNACCFRAFWCKHRIDESFDMGRHTVFSEGDEIVDGNDSVVAACLPFAARMFLSVNSYFFSERLLHWSFSRHGEVAKSKPRAGRWLGWVAWRDASASTWLSGVLVPVHVGMVGEILRLAANACSPHLFLFATMLRSSPVTFLAFRSKRCSLS